MVSFECYKRGDSNRKTEATLPSKKNTNTCFSTHDCEIHVDCEAGSGEAAFWYSWVKVVRSDMPFTTLHSSLLLGNDAWKCSQTRNSLLWQYWGLHHNSKDILSPSSGQSSVVTVPVHSGNKKPIMFYLGAHWAGNVCWHTKQVDIQPAGRAMLRTSIDNQNLLINVAEQRRLASP